VEEVAANVGVEDACHLSDEVDTPNGLAYEIAVLEELASTQSDDEVDGDKTAVSELLGDPNWLNVTDGPLDGEPAGLLAMEYWKVSKN
jgi:hypothetical protein